MRTKYQVEMSIKIPIPFYELSHLFQELYLAYNEIDDLSGVSMIENLEILDLEG